MIINSKIFTIFIILAIVSAGTIGIFAFETIGHGDMDCPVAAFSGEVCSAMTTAFAMTLHHISGFQSLTQSVLSSNISLLLLSLIALAFIGLVFTQRLCQEFLEYEAILFEIFRTDKKIQPNRFVDMLQKWFISIKNRDHFSYAFAYENMSI